MDVRRMVRCCGVSIQLLRSVPLRRQSVVDRYRVGYRWHSYGIVVDCRFVELVDVYFYICILCVSHEMQNPLVIWNILI